ncbi:MAG: type II toxin-antitoxin system HicB family antitoxin [Candidatus Magasanikbacteria bacterium]|nr:type II toxin-antitoxin system HicB family antitoxin [Candidatus Magasanikbacteria bacterium]
MLTDFINKQLALAHYKLLKDGSYFGEISGLTGVWASAATLEACRAELQEVLESWLIVKMMAGDKVPGFATTAKRNAVLQHA